MQPQGKHESCEVVAALEGVWESEAGLCLRQCLKGQASGLSGTSKAFFAFMTPSSLTNNGNMCDNYVGIDR